MPGSLEWDSHQDVFNCSSCEWRAQTSLLLAAAPAPGTAAAAAIPAVLPAAQAVRGVRAQRHKHPVGSPLHPIRRRLIARPLVRSHGSKLRAPTIS